VTRLSRQSRVWACELLAVGLVLCPVAANSGDGVADGFALRNQNPFLQIFGLPPLQSAALARHGETHFGIVLELANHADAGDNGVEKFAIDGDYHKLHGSGATDFSLGVYASDTHTLFAHDLGVSGFVGGVFLGDGKVLANMQRSAVPFAGVSARWHATERLGFVAQLYAQGAYFNSDLEELGGETIQLAIGLTYRPPRRALLLKFAVVEDVTANATTDFGLHVAIQSSGDR